MVPAITVSDTSLMRSWAVAISSSTKRLDVLVIDVLLAVGERLEPHEGVFQLVAGELIAEFLQLVHKGVPAGMLAHDQRSLFHADTSGVMIS